MKNLNKDTFREIKDTLSRFISILLIVGIGVFVLVGLISTGPIMRQNAQNKIQDENMEDILVSSVIGFEDEDIEKIESQTNLKEIEYGYEVQLKDDRTGELVSIFNMPYKIGLPSIIEGREIESKNEILLDYELKKFYKLGDKISFRKESGVLDIKDEDKLFSYEYEIVGFAQSMSYISNRTRGQSIEGLGEIKGFGYISPEQFNTDIKFAKIIYDDTTGIDTFTKKYKDNLNPHITSLEIDFNLRPQERYTGIKDDLTDEILQGEIDIDEARKRLSDGEKELADARKELADGKDKLKDGEEELNEKSSEGRDKLNSAKKKLDDARLEIESNEKKLKDGEAELKDSEKKLSDAKQELDEGKKKLDDGNKEILDGEIEYNDGEKKFERGAGEITASKKSLDEAEKQLSDGRRKLDEGLEKIEQSKKQLEEGLRKYNEGLTQYQAGEKEYQAGVEQLANGLGTSQDLSEIEKKITENETYINLADEAINQYNKLDSQILGLEQKIEKNNQDISKLENEKSTLDSSDPRYLEIEQEIVNKNLENETLRQNYQMAVELKKQLDTQLSNLAQQYGMDLSNLSGIKNEIKTAREGLNQLKESRKKLDSAKLELESSKKQLEDGQKQLQEGIATAEKGELEYQKNLEKFYDGKSEYEKGLKELDEARIKLDNAKAELIDGKRKLNDAQIEYEKGVKEYNDGKIKYEKGKVEYESGLERLEDGKQVYKDGLEQYKDSEDEFKTQIDKAKTDLDKAKSELYKGEKELKEGEQEYRDKKAEAEEEILDGEEKLKDAKKVLKLLKIPRYSIVPRYSNAYLNAYLKDAKSVDLLGLVFPGFFFLIAMLVTFTTMTRMVEENRTMIGTYKALGYKPSEISKKYFIYGASAAIIGGIIGAFLGSFVLPKIIANAYSTTTIFENNLKYYNYPLKIIFSIIAGLIFSAFSALISVRATLREKTSNLLRQKAPKSGNRILVERIPFIWHNMSFLFKVTARNLFRYKKRMIMTLIGIMGCTALLILGFGLNGSVNGIKDKQFGQIMKYNLLVTYDRDLDEQSYIEYLEKREKYQYEKGEFNLEQFEFEYEDVSENLTLISSNSNSELHNFIDVRDRTSAEKIDLPERGIVLSEKTAKLLGVKKGQTISIINQENIEYEVEVEEIMEMYMGHYAIMSDKYYKRVFKKDYLSNTDIYRVTGSIEEIKKDFSEYKTIVSMIDTNSVENIMDQYMFSIGKVQIIITIASALLAMIVLYNLTNINIEERKRELSTIKVLGFYSKETTAYVYRETWTLTIIGIMIGMIMGKILHYVVLQVVVPYEAMLDPNLTLDSYIKAIFITLFVNFIIMIIFHNKLRKIDMVESLKSNE